MVLYLSRIRSIQCWTTVVHHLHARSARPFYCTCKGGVMTLAAKLYEIKLKARGPGTKSARGARGAGLPLTKKCEQCNGEVLGFNSATTWGRSERSVCCEGVFMDMDLCGYLYIHPRAKQPDRLLSPARPKPCSGHPHSRSTYSDLSFFPSTSSFLLVLPLSCGCLHNNTLWLVANR